MTNQINQQAKVNPKAIISLVLGIFSVIISWTGYIYGSIHSWLDSTLIVSSLLIPLAGLIFGITGLKSTKKSLAIIGIILNIIGLLGALFFNLFIKGMAESM